MTGCLLWTLITPFTGSCCGGLASLVGHLSGLVAAVSEHAGAWWFRRAGASGWEPAVCRVLAVDSVAAIGQIAFTQRTGMDRLAVTAASMAGLAASLAPSPAEGTRERPLPADVTAEQVLGLTARQQAILARACRDAILGPVPAPTAPVTVAPSSP